MSLSLFCLFICFFFRFHIWVKLYGVCLQVPHFISEETEAQFGQRMVRSHFGDLQLESGFLVPRPIIFFITKLFSLSFCVRNLLQEDKAMQCWPDRMYEIWEGQCRSFAETMRRNYSMDQFCIFEPQMCFLSKSWYSSFSTGCFLELLPSH